MTRWLLERAAIVPIGLSDLSLVSKAWDALAALSPRFNRDTAIEVVNAATSHESWNADKNDRLRAHIIQAVDGCINILFR